MHRFQGAAPIPGGPPPSLRPKRPAGRYPPPTAQLPLASEMRQAAETANSVDSMSEEKRRPLGCVMRCVCAVNRRNRRKASQPQG
jgi:hypothetical protein